MSQTVTITCDRCGKLAPANRTQWAYVDIRSEDWTASYDLCSVCRNAVMSEATLHRKAAS